VGASRRRRPSRDDDTIRRRRADADERTSIFPKEKNLNAQADHVEQQAATLTAA
jgi:hypothetical protein